ncbi:protein scribble homolog [Grus americana]|uniref:protein scribble homolog n=1 Tax=Grus americana TaxID=9117 RepID=UPI002407B858|nr:protein scribble homolog [Grus americana]
MLKVGLFPRSCKSLKASTIFSSLCLLFVSPVLPIVWQSVSLGLKVPLKDSIKWLPKSPKLYSGHNWSSQGSRWASLKGKEGFHGGNLYKFSSANGKWREGRISPEQEAEELEDPDEDEPISKFSGSLFDTDNSMREQRNTRTALQEKHKSAMKGKTLPGTKAQPPVLAAGSFLSESSRFPEELRAVEVPQPPLKITITVCSQMGSLGISIAGGKGSSPCKDNDEGIVIARLPKDGPADLAGAQAGDRVAEASLVSEPDALDAVPTEASTKGSPFPTVNHVITIPRIILTRPSTSDEDTDQLPPDPDDFEPEEPDSAGGCAYSDCLNSAFYPP